MCSPNTKAMPKQLSRNAFNFLEANTPLQRTMNSLFCCFWGSDGAGAVCDLFLSSSGGGGSLGGGLVAHATKSGGRQVPPSELAPEHPGGSHMRQVLHRPVHGVVCPELICCQSSGRT